MNKVTRFLSRVPFGPDDVTAIVSPKRTIWSAHNLKLEDGPQLCIGRQMTYSSAYSNSLVNSVESARPSFCSRVRDSLGVKFAEIHASSITGMSIAVRSRDMTS